jgi:hypothetical protein
VVGRPRRCRHVEMTPKVAALKPVLGGAARVASSVRSIRLSANVERPPSWRQRRVSSSQRCLAGTMASNHMQGGCEAGRVGVFLAGCFGGCKYQGGMEVRRLRVGRGWTRNVILDTPIRLLHTAVGLGSGQKWRGQGLECRVVGREGTSL